LKTVIFPRFVVLLLFSAMAPKFPAIFESSLTSVLLLRVLLTFFLMSCVRSSILSRIGLLPVRLFLALPLPALPLTALPLPALPLTALPLPALPLPALPLPALPRKEVILDYGFS
jgi:hypothetical protein